MKKISTITLVISVLVLMSSCARMKMIKDIMGNEQLKPYLFGTQKVYTENGRQKFDLVNHQILLPATIDGKKDTVEFDTGASSYFISIAPKENMVESECTEIKTVAHFSKTGLKMKLFGIDKLSFDQFAVNKCFAQEIYMNNPCNQKIYSLLGILAFDSRPFVLNFDDNEIIFCNKDVLNIQEWTSVPVKIKMNCFVVTMNIDGKDVDLVFDTGSPYTMLKKSYYKPTKGDAAFEGAIGVDVYGNTDESGFEVAEKKCNIGKTNLLTTNIFYMNVNNNILGMNVIEQYNWFFDRKNKTLYCKKNNKDTKEALIAFKNAKDIKQLQYVSKINDGELVIIAKNKKTENGYPLLSKIKSINGELVTEENICHYEQLLNENPTDWSQFKIEIK